MHHIFIWDQLGVSGDVALRRKNGALSIEATSASIDAAFVQAKALKAGFVCILSEHSVRVCLEMM